jgi:O-antigen biosynthesis protein WbqP
MNSQEIYMDRQTVCNRRSYLLFKRVFDICSALALFIVTLPLFIAVALAIKLNSKGPVFHVSKRVGRDNVNFKMLKFRTMRTDAPQLATHLMSASAANYVTGVGRFLRRTSLDELPQLLNVIKGDMSVVGPRPALFNQDDQIALRTECGAHRLTPGITGWAQTHGRDEIPIAEKVALDRYYMERQSFKLDMYILWLSLKQAFCGVGVSH